MKLIKSKKFHLIHCTGGYYICYNTILNNPLILDEQSYQFFINQDVIDLAATNFLEDKNDLVEALKDSYLFFPEGVDETTIAEEKNIEHLRKVANGETLEFLDLRISEKCNFGCKHCISSKAQSGNIMTEKTAINAIDYVIAFLRARKADFSKINIHYGNAEPLMNFPLLKKIQNHMAGVYPDVNKICSINTNLSLLTKEQARFLIDQEVSVYTSLDGRKEANDLIRIFKNGKGTFDVILKKIGLLKNMGKPLEGVSVTITEKNFKYFDTSFIDWCAERGYWSLAIDFDLVNSLNIPMQERVDFLSSMWEKCQKNRMEFFGTWITPFLNLSNRSIVDKHYSFCKGIHGKSVSIAPDGMVYLCGSSSTSLGHYQKIEAIFSENSKLHRIVSSRLIGRNEMCKGCIIEGACAGQCFVTHEYSQKNRQRLCDFYRAITEKMLTIQAASDWS